MTTALVLPTGDTSSSPFSAVSTQAGVSPRSTAALASELLAEKRGTLVEEQVYQEFERISERGGVLGAMDTMYQRGKIQEESLYYESKKHDGSLPLIGVNTFLPKEGQEDEVHELELIRSNDGEKQDQIRHVRTFQGLHENNSSAALAQLQAVARERGNVFGELMETVKSSSLGQISAALYEVGGEYRRNM